MLVNNSAGQLIMSLTQEGSRCGKVLKGTQSQNCLRCLWGNSPPLAQVLPASQLSWTQTGLTSSRKVFFPISAFWLTHAHTQGRLEPRRALPSRGFEKMPFLWLYHSGCANVSYWSKHLPGSRAHPPPQGASGVYTSLRCWGNWPGKKKVQRDQAG